LSEASAPTQRWISMSKTPDMLVDLLQSPSELRLEKGGLAFFELVGQGDAIGDGGRARPHQFLQFLERLGGGGERPRLQTFAQDRQQARVERIGLVELTDSLREQTRPQRIDHRDRKARGVQSAMRLAMVFAGGFHHHQGDRHSRDPALDGFEAFGRVRHAELLANGM
jgi:hypothetical protein